MAIDTTEKRYSMIHWGEAAPIVYPLTVGSTAEQQHLLGFYSGVAFAPPTVDLGIVSTAVRGLSVERPFRTAVITFNGNPVIDPAWALRESARLGVDWSLWRGKANSFTLTNDDQPGYGYLLVESKYVDVNKTDNVVAFLEDNSVEIDNVIIVDVQSILSTPEKCVYFITLGTIEYVWKHLSSFEKVYNLLKAKDLQSSPGRFHSATINGSSPWTYQEIANDVASKLPGTAPAIAQTFPSAEPTNYTWRGESPWDALWQLRFSGVWNAVHGAGITFKMVDGGSVNSTQNSLLIAARANRCIDLSHKQLSTKAKIPATLEIRFPARKYDFQTADYIDSSDVHRVTNGKTESRTAANYGHANTITGTKKIIFSKLAARYNEVGVVQNQTEITAEADRIATNFFGEFNNGETDDVFSGVWKFEPGPHFSLVQWFDVGDGLLTRVEEYKRPGTALVRSSIGTNRASLDDVPYERKAVCTATTNIAAGGHASCTVHYGTIAGGTITWANHTQAIEVHTVSETQIDSGTRFIAEFHWQTREWISTSTTGSGEDLTKFVRVWRDTGNKCDEFTSPLSGCLYEGNLVSWTGTDLCPANDRWSPAHAHGGARDIYIGVANVCGATDLKAGEIYLAQRVAVATTIGGLGAKDLYGVIAPVSPEEKFALVQVDDSTSPPTLCTAIDDDDFKAGSCIWEGLIIVAKAQAVDASRCNFPTETPTIQIYITTLNACPQINELKMGEKYFGYRIGTYDPDPGGTSDERDLYVVQPSPVDTDKHYKFKLETGEDFLDGTASARIYLPSVTIDGTGPIETIEDPLSLFPRGKNTSTGWCIKYTDGATDKYYVWIVRQRAFYGTATLQQNITTAPASVSITAAAGTAIAPFDDQVISATQATNRYGLTGQINDPVFIVYDEVADIWVILQNLKRPESGVQELFTFQLRENMGGTLPLQAQADIYNPDAVGPAVASDVTLYDPWGLFTQAKGDTVTGANGTCVKYNGQYYAVMSEQHTQWYRGVANNTIDGAGPFTIGTLVALDQTPDIQSTVGSTVPALNIFGFKGKTGGGDTVIIRRSHPDANWIIVQIEERGMVRLNEADPLDYFHNQLQDKTAYNASQDLIIPFDLVGAGDVKERAFVDANIPLSYNTGIEQVLGHLAGASPTITWFPRSTATGDIIRRFTLTASMSAGTATATITNPDGTGSVSDTINDPGLIYTEAKTGSKGWAVLWTNGKYYAIQGQQESRDYYGTLSTGTPLIGATTETCTVENMVPLDKSPFNQTKLTTATGVKNIFGFDASAGAVVHVAWDYTHAYWYVVDVIKSGRLRMSATDLLEYLGEKFNDLGTLNTSRADFRVRAQLDTPPGAQNATLFIDGDVDITNYDNNIKQYLTHPAGGGLPRWDTLPPSSGTQEMYKYDLQSSFTPSGTATANIYEPNGVVPKATGVQLNDPYGQYPRAIGDTTFSGSFGDCVLWQGAYYVVTAQQQSFRMAGLIQNAMDHNVSPVTVTNCVPMDNSPFNQRLSITVSALNRFKLKTTVSNAPCVVQWDAGSGTSGQWVVTHVDDLYMVKVDSDDLTPNFLWNKLFGQGTYVASQDLQLRFRKIDTTIAGGNGDQVGGFVDSNVDIAAYVQGTEQFLTHQAGGAYTWVDRPTVTPDGRYKVTALDNLDYAEDQFKNRKFFNSIFSFDLAFDVFTVSGNNTQIRFMLHYPDFTDSSGQSGATTRVLGYNDVVGWHITAKASGVDTDELVKVRSADAAAYLENQFRFLDNSVQGSTGRDWFCTPQTVNIGGDFQMEFHARSTSIPGYSSSGTFNLQLVNNVLQWNSGQDKDEKAAVTSVSTPNYLENLWADVSTFVSSEDIATNYQTVSNLQKQFLNFSTMRAQGAFSNSAQYLLGFDGINEYISGGKSGLILMPYKWIRATLAASIAPGSTGVSVTGVTYHGWGRNNSGSLIVDSYFFTAATGKKILAKWKGPETNRYEVFNVEC